jgi:hypothetical protein
VIRVENPRGVTRGVSTVEIDGMALAACDAVIPLTDDGETHHVRAVLGD